MRFFILLIASCISLPGVAGAQELALADRGPRFMVAPTGHAKAVQIDPARAPIFQRRVTLSLEHATRGEALSAVAEQAGIRLVYSRDVLDPNAPTRIKADGISVAAALTEILLGAGVDVVLSQGDRVTLAPRREAAPPATGTIVGRVTDANEGAPLAGAIVDLQGTAQSASSKTDGRFRITDVPPGTYTVRARFIGYAPGTASVTVVADQEATADFALKRSAQVLNEVVTTGTVVPTEVKALPTPISVLTADDIQRQNLQRVDQAFRGFVPGAIAWDQGPVDQYSPIAVRGASTLSGVPTIKTFIDGVEVANSQYITTIDPNSIDRIEIIRGPQASTLYGAGALSGVMQIFTKRGQLGLSRPEVTAKLSGGGVGGYDGQSTAAETDNAVTVAGGSEKTSYSLGGSYRRLGEWVPAYGATNWGATAGGQTTQGPLTLSSFLRYADKRYDEPWDTRFSSYQTFSRPNNLVYRLRQQSYGLTATLQPLSHWQHTLTLGYDQSYSSIDQMRPALTSPADTALLNDATHESKVSLLYHTDLDVSVSRTVRAVVTAGVNYDATDYADAFTGGATRSSGTFDGFSFVTRTPGWSTGYFGQLQIAVAERLFLTGGLRAERNADFGAQFGTAWSPRVGAAYTMGLGPVNVKTRISYGESIRAPAAGARDASVTPFSEVLANPDLAPERQRGGDGGIDVYIGRISVGATYYNQRAIGLIQLVTIPTAPGTLVTYQNQNLSRVKNDGWEFEVHLPLGLLQLDGTYSITNSTVAELPPNYLPGGYKVGDQILQIPRSSAGAAITYSPLRQTTLTARVTHFGHWTGMDYLSYYGFLLGGQPYRGSQRAYWIEYPTVTKFTVGVSQVLSRNLTAFAQAENLGNNLRYEQNNFNIPMPRQVTFGARLRY